MLQCGSTSLTVVVNSASNLAKVETMGKNDPYVQFSLNYEDKNSYQKTFTQKNSGEEATWNQSFTLPLNNEADLFLEVMDEESTIPELIGFAAIPIRQVVHSQNATFFGSFDIFTLKGENAGKVILTLIAQGFPNSPQGETTIQYIGEPPRGQSYIHEGHKERAKSLRNKGRAADAAAGILGAGFAIGGALLGHKIYKDHQSAEEERAAEEARRQEEQERFERERQEFNDEKERYERERQEGGHDNSGEHEHGHEHSHHHRRHEHCEDEGERGAREWDPIGTYAAGDRVRYHGHTYVCLQGHTSNPTWQPGAAHSLWQPE
ncbi:C2 domain-containing protein [Radiomyces spectabilis]|uniref:C2 domain-containing protein n=1 Tax=Radiomyces spectabilis TaxID=64574 RepID=UPI00221FDADD|nr:C2 domain-containing protein [Radiomyces spectabilis]KAI8364726.1 C2 domain-containing protein [Radiomyces spectabilis]